MSHASELIETDIETYLKQHEQKDLLRFITCGSVDDGKSTFIGRLLHDSALVYEDQLAAVQRDSSRYGTTGDEVDLALLVDGLQSEREQGITIDVAYRYFSTDRRKFIIADTPGHEQYTRNMATGASTAQLAVILVDARSGIQVQTRRHSYICSLLGIRHVLLAVNKMDLVDWDQTTFEAIRTDYESFARRLGIPNVRCVPLSALKGDNVVRRSNNLHWYDGPTFMELLETIEVKADRNLDDLRLPIQTVIRPSHEFRGFAGTLAAGIARPGDPVVALPAGTQSHIERIVTHDGDLDYAFAPQSVTITLTDEIDVSRGMLLSSPKRPATVADALDARVVWMAEQPLLPGRQYDIKLATATVPAVIEQIHHRIDVNTLENCPTDSLELNEIGLCRVQLSAPVAFDPYDEIADTGAFIIIDRISLHTVGAGMATRQATETPGTEKDVPRRQPLLTKTQRAGQKGQRPCTIWLTGLSGSGKSTLANALEQALFRRGYHSYLIDAGNIRHGLSHDLGFSRDARAENIRRIAETATMFVDAGLIVVCASLSPYRDDREMVRERLEPGEMIEVHVDAPVELCRERDSDDIYSRADAGEIHGLPGVDITYEAPAKPEVHIDSSAIDVDESVEKILQVLKEKGVIRL
ncbi:sulfate adenylyltransferase subunit 1 [Halorhodospira halochloris]|uniref:Multifunctional fusion protein n=1 Tax=Halorhodospira halochloris TaxID=1052 RepID=A0A120MZK0_HALHR|nr:sulfate adenylyltransferase subunit CysN [Halorhodospira halochloris]MBK1650920.1 bifunctional sulfate adenylyltransferase subunit 1/adenylylsulfate kinase [Halorhodospira halochloris]BAU56576.1 sulfate adenylyltransferase subunit 1 [Halorhodospira halochloris]